MRNASGARPISRRGSGRSAGHDAGSAPDTATAASRRADTSTRLREVATFATDIGPAKGLVASNPQLVEWAHAAELTVTPYGFRSADTGEFPDVASEMRHYLYTLGVDALFTDNPDMFPR